VAGVIATSARRPVAAPVLATAAVLGGCVALALVDPASGPPVCPFRALTGYDCPGCGGTRAAHQLLTGHLAAAADLNLLAVVAVPVLVWALWVGLVRAFGGPRLPTPSVSRRWGALVLAVVAVFWVVRNIPGTPLSWLGTTA
jgi:hypothetical protein